MQKRPATRAEDAHIAYAIMVVLLVWAWPVVKGGGGG